MDKMMRTDEQGNSFDLRPRSCPICVSSSTRLIGYRGGKYQRYGLGVETRIVQCIRCSLLFPDPFPFPVDPQRLYGDPAKYFGTDDDGVALESYRQLVREMARRTGGRSLAFVDVGSGRGGLLAAAKLEGAEAVGLELSHAMVEYARQRYGVEVIPQSIEEFVEGRAAAFDAVVLNAVLEHVHDPDAMMRAAARLVRPGGILYIDVPNEPHLLSMVGNTWNRALGNPAVFNLSPTWPPYHVFGFNPKAISLLLQKHHFSMTEVTIRAVPSIPSGQLLSDRLRAWVGSQINRVANWTGTASNMCLWAKRIPGEG
jgi:SAM-dependent methyltransferase